VCCVPIHIRSHFLTSLVSIYHSWFKVENGPQFQNALYELTGQRTVPNVFVKGQHIGGSDAVAAALANGRITEILSEADKEL